MEWQTDVSETEIIQEVPGMVGTRFREAVGQKGRTVEMYGVITEYRTNQLLSMHLQSKYHSVDVEWQLHQMEAAARLTVTSNIRFKSFMRVIVVFIRPLIAGRILAELQEELRRLQRLCERDPSSP